MRPRIFVTQEKRDIDYSAAEQWGDIVFLSHQPIWASSSGKTVKAAGHKMVEVLHRHDYKPGTDFLLPSGSVANMFLACRAMNLYTGGVRILLWDNRLHNYTELKVEN